VAFQYEPYRPGDKMDLIEGQSKITHQS
jgi:hypothetical protein